jgi:hypothetical protein
MFVYLGYVFVSDGDAVDTGVSEREPYCRLAIFAVEAALAHKSSQKPWRNRGRQPKGDCAPSA